jgi:hypothetical protein
LISCNLRYFGDDALGAIWSGPMIQARQFAIALSIATLYPALIFYGVRTYCPFPEPQYHVVVTARITPTTPEGWRAWEEEDRANEKRRNEELAALRKAAEPFFRTLIFVATPLGLAAIFIGSYLRNHAVGAGLVLGGMITVANGYWGYWNHLDNWVRWVSLLLGFCILVFVGYRQFVLARNSPT